MFHDLTALVVNIFVRIKRVLGLLSLPMPDPLSSNLTKLEPFSINKNINVRINKFINFIITPCYNALVALMPAEYLHSGTPNSKVVNENLSLSEKPVSVNSRLNSVQEI